MNELDTVEALTGAVARRHAIRPAAPALGWTRAPRIARVDSSNHGALGAAVDLVNLANGAACELTPEGQRQRFDAYVSGPALDREAYQRGVYLEWALRFLRIARALWPELGDAPRGQRAHECLRAVFAHLALGAVPVDAKILDDRTATHPGPACFVANGPATRLTRNRPAVTTCGARSANRKPAGTAGRAPRPGDPPARWREWSPAGIAVTLADALGGHLDDLGAALALRPAPARWLPEEEAAVLRRVLHDDRDAMATACDWLRLWLPATAFRIVRAEKWVVTYCLDGRGGSTGSLDACAILRATGIGLFLCANTGDREHAGGPDNVKPTHCVVAEDGASALAQVDDGELDAVELGLPASIRLLDVEYGVGVWNVRVPASGTAPPPTDPPPATTARRESWWRRLWRRWF